jgi:hypothetical protein
MNLTENQKRLLTEFLGECWHEYIKQPPLEKWEIDQGYIQTALCSCGSHSCLKSNRTFTTYQDLGDCMGKLVEKGKLADFVEWVLNYAYCNKIILSRREHVGVAWCWWETLSALDRCQLVAEFLEDRK